MLVVTLPNGEESVTVLPAAGGSPVFLGTANMSTGGSIVPLSIAFYVDAGSVSTGTPDGSIANPFRTMQAAVDAIAVQGAGFILVVSAVGGAGFVVPPGVAYIQVRGLGAGPSGFPGIGPVTQADGGNAELDFQGVGVAIPGDWTVQNTSVTFTSCVLPSINVDATGSDVRLISCLSTANISNFNTLKCWGALSLGGSWLGGASAPQVDDVSERAVMTSLFPFALIADLGVLGRLDDVVPSTIIGDDADEPVSQGFRYTLAPETISATRTLSLFNPITVPGGQAWSQWIDVYKQSAGNVVITGPGGIGTLYTVGAGSQPFRFEFFFPAGGPSWSVRSVKQLT